MVFQIGVEFPHRIEYSLEGQVTSLRAFFGSARAVLPRATFARWASALFSCSVLTFVISIAASQALLALASLGYLIHFLVELRRNQFGTPPRRFPPIKLPLALFCLLTVLSIFWAADPAVGWFAARKLVLFLILLLTVELVTGLTQQVFLFQGMFLGSALAGIAAIAQFAAEYRAARALHPANLYLVMTSERIHGLMGHWMNFGGQQMLVFCASLSYLLLSFLHRPAPASSAGTEPEPKPTGMGKIAWVLFAVIAFSIVLNFTRGVWLGCFVATVYLVARWRKRWLWALPVLVVASYLVAPSLLRQRIQILRHPTLDPSLSIRFEMWQVALRMIGKHPWLGVGPNNIEREYPLYLPPGKPPEVGYHEHFHDNFLQLGAERGLPCLAAWVWMMLALAWHLGRVRQKLAREGRPTWVADAALAGWLAFLAEGCFEFNFGTSPVLMVFLFLVSVPFALDRRSTVYSQPSDAGKCGMKRESRF